MFEYIRRIHNLGSVLGWSQAFIYLVQKLRCLLFNQNENYTLISKNSQYPLICRPKTSDRGIFDQIFVEREYSCFDDLSNVDLIIDCGANVGYSSAYFLTRFPKCIVICIESDRSNFKILEENLTPYKDRVKLISTGIWSHSTGLKILETSYGGEACAVQVRECKPGEVPEMQATDVGTLLKESGLNKISILKMDVEGAEAVVFAKNYESWIPYVDNIAIELHDNTSFGQATDVVLNVMSSYKQFNMSESGELTIFKACI